MLGEGSLNIFIETLINLYKYFYIKFTKDYVAKHL